MDKAVQTKLIQTLEDIKKMDENDSEYWSARELAPLLDYSTYDTFLAVVERAMQSCKTSGIEPDNHFKKTALFTEKGRAVPDYKLSRYACYIIAQNGSPTKAAIATAQMYFAVQTRRQEVMSTHIEEIKRIEARKKLTETEKRFAETLYQRGIDGKGISEIRSVGDEVLFGGNTTQQMKEKLGVAPSKPLADFLPTVTIKAKDLAAEITTVNTREKNLSGKPKIKEEHKTNNSEVRELLGRRGIIPEKLPKEDDIKKVETKLRKTFGQIESKESS